MGALGIQDYGAIGSTNGAWGHHTYHSERTGEGKLQDVNEEVLDDEKIAGFGAAYAKKRSLETYRSDALSDISSGLNVVASGIRVITTILSLLGAGTVER